MDKIVTVPSPSEMEPAFAQISDLEVIVFDASIRPTSPGKLMLLNARMQGANGFTELLIMLDSGSQTSFITPDALDRIQHTVGKTTRIEVTGIAGNKTVAMSKKIGCSFAPSAGPEIPICCYVLNNFVSPFVSWDLCNADQGYIKRQQLVVNHVTGTVRPDMLLGVDHMFKLLRPNAQNRSLPSGLQLLDTVYDFVPCGSETQEECESTTPLISFANTIRIEDIADSPPPERVQTPFWRPLH